jgi:hypothetical protein
MLKLSLNASNPTEISRPTTKFGKSGVSLLPPSLTEQDGIKEVPLSPKAMRLIDARTNRTKSQNPDQWNRRSETPTSARKYHWLKWSTEEKSVERSADDILQDLMAGSLLKPDSSGSEKRLGLVTEDMEDETTPEKLDVLQGEPGKSP